MDPLHPSDPERIGRYRLTRRLGAGGMGQIYLARTAAGRQVVVKVIRPEHVSDTDFRARFAREATAARTVGGFHTAQVVDADPDADPPWIATTYIPGPSLHQFLGEHGALEPATVRVLAAGLAEGLETIHAAGVVHRDLKPGNIILADDGPRIIDFGIARALDTTTMTATGAVLGTLPYMSPEQTEGHDIGPASDIFSLGTVLAFAATGTNPYAASTPAATIRALIGPTPTLNGLPDDLATLVTNCWNHAPDQRPSPAQILTQCKGSDLDCAWPPTAANGHPPQPAEPVATTEELAPPPADSEAATAASDNGTAPPSNPSSPHRPGKRGATASFVRRRPRTVAGVAITAVAVGGIVAIVPTISPPAEPTTSPREPVATFTGHNDQVHSTAFAPDGTTLATASRDGTARLWDAESGKETTTLIHDGEVMSVAFAPDGETLATGTIRDGSQGAARLWDAESGEETTTLDDGEPVHSVAFAPDGQTLATGTTSGARLWDVDSGEETTTLDDDTVKDVAFSPDGAILAAANQGCTTVDCGAKPVRLWDVDSGEEITTFGLTRSASSLAFAPNGLTLAIGTRSEDALSGVAELWNVNSGTRTTALHLDKPVQSVAFAPDGETLATGSEEVGSRLWDMDSESEATAIDADSSVASVAFSPDGETLATGRYDSTVRLWDVP